MNKYHKQIYIIMEKVIEYIEDNIKKAISLDDIAEHVNISKYHLHRLFKCITNQKLMSYVKDRELSQSVQDLLHTDLNIIDIASEYGYNHEQSYIRAFKQNFNTSPKRFRLEKNTIQITQKINPSNLNPLGEYGVFIEPVIIVKPAFYLIGIEYRVNSAENDRIDTSRKAAFDFSLNYAPKIFTATSPHVFIDRCQGYPDTHEFFKYMPCLEVSDITDVPEGMIGYPIPTQKYAVFKYFGLHHPEILSHSLLKELYNYAQNIWPAHSGYQSPPYIFKFIDLSICREDYCELELLAPIVEKD